MAEQQEKKDVYLIPPNFIDTGTLFGGMMKARNAFEAVLLVAGISILVLKLNITLTTKIIVLCLTALPVGLFAVIGVAGESLTSFLYHFILFLKNRRIVYSHTAVNTGFMAINQQDKRKESAADFQEEIEESKKNKVQKKKQHRKYKKAKGADSYIPIDKIENGIIYTTDKRMLKILEVVPINFLLKSAREQRNIIYSFISYLKISPIKLQFKVVTKKADINKHLNQVKQEIIQEQNIKCRALQEDYAKLLQRIGNKEAITRRFFIIFEYEAFLNGQKEESDGMAHLEVAARTAKTYLFQCGNEVVEHENEDEFLHEILYLLLNRTTSVHKPLAEKAAEVMGEYAAQNQLAKLNNIPITRFISPDYIDLMHGRYILLDGLYYAFLYLPSDGYKTQVGGGWLSLLINAGEGIDIDIFCFRQPRDRIQLKIGQQLRINRSKMKETSDTNTDFDDLDSAIRSGYYLKDGISNNQDFYYISILITITATSLKELEWRQNEMKKLMVSQDLDIRNCSLQQEQAFLSALPLVKLDKSLFTKAKRNALTLGAASCYPFTSFEMSDDNGILLGVNKYNNSLIIIDIFNSRIYKNANMAILGTTGAGKTFTMQLMALKQMNVLNSMGFHKFPESYEDLSLDVAMLAEHIACGMRHLVYVSSSIDKARYMEQAGIVLRVQATIEKYGVKIEIPCLLPKRKKGGSCEFIIDPLYYELNSFVMDQKMERFRECVIVFQHVYNKTLPLKKIRDYDNVLEPKKILDVINTFLLTDDSGSFIDIFQTISLENRDCTRILVMSHADFSLWIQEQNLSTF